MAPPNRPPVRRPPARPPPRSDTEPEAPAVDPELSVSTRRRVARRAKEPVAKSKSKAPLLLAVLVVLGIAGAAGYKQLNKPPPAPATPDPSIEQGKLLVTMFQEGKNLVRAGKWVEARAKFAAVVEQQPQFASGAVQTYLTACEKEVPNQKRFDEAAAALERGEVGPAQRALNAVSADTQQILRRDDLQAKIQVVFKQRLLDARDLATAPGDGVKMKRLQKLAEDLLLVRADDRDALEFKSLADRSLRPHTVEHVELPHDDPGLQVQKLFAQGDTTGALKAAHECEGAADSCRVLAGKIEEFNGLLQRVEALQAAELDAALKLERAVGAVKATPQGKPIHTRLAAVYYPKASAARAKGDWPSAMEHALKVVDADPGHAGGGAIVTEGRERARDLYLRCYTQRATNADEAAPLCAEAIRILPPGDPSRERAEKVLESMRAK